MSRAAIWSASCRTPRRRWPSRSICRPGYRIAWSGEFENQRRAAARLAVVVPLALALIFLMLFATLRSIRQATLIIVNIPFALVGGVLALWISGEYLSVPASVGFIALLGIAVLNGLVLISYFNQLHAEETDMRRVVFEGAQRRLRPVLMTASIAAFGLVPLLFASGPGAEIQKPLAIVVIGGLVTSTLLTLFLLPILFERFGVAGAKEQAAVRCGGRRECCGMTMTDTAITYQKLTLVCPEELAERLVDLLLDTNVADDGLHDHQGRRPWPRLHQRFGARAGARPCRPAGHRRGIAGR